MVARTTAPEALTPGPGERQAAVVQGHAQLARELMLVVECTGAPAAMVVQPAAVLPE